LFVDERDFYYASFMSVVGERCRPYGSRKPRFRKANALITHILVDFEKILAVQHVSTERCVCVAFVLLGSEQRTSLCEIARAKEDDGHHLNCWSSYSSAA